MKEYEPLVFDGGATGALLIHGFAGSPGEMLPLARLLADAGLSVRVPLLPGHSENPATLAGIPWQAWAETCDAELAALRARCARVWAVGFSMGGLLALRLAGLGRVDGVAAIAPALRLRGQEFLPLLGVARYIVPYYYPLEKADFADPGLRANIAQRSPELNLDDPQVVTFLRKEVKLPVASLYQLYRLQRAAAPLLPRIAAPTLLFQGMRDETVVPTATEALLTTLRAEPRELIRIPDGTHQISRGPDHPMIAARIIEWMARG